MIAAAQTASQESTRPQAECDRFYKQELDALRFLAFLMVLVHHGPVTGSLTGVVRAGGFGLSIFFLLSAYLITEPQPVCYLGKISYGLYVFHITVRNLVSHMFPEIPGGHTLITMVSEDLAMLAITILLAHLSYRYFESKFLKLKEAYSRIPSRPV